MKPQGSKWEELKDKLESPVLAFNEICFRYIYNDWIGMVANMFAFGLSMLILFASALHK